MDRAGRLAAGCLLALMLALAAGALLSDVSREGWEHGAVAVGGALALALIGGVALLVEARAGTARPGLGTPVDAAVGGWLLSAALACAFLELVPGQRGWPLALLLMALAYLLAIRTLTTPARARAATAVALATLVAGCLGAGIGWPALLAAAFGATVSLGLARAVRPDAGPALRKLARAFGKATRPLVLAGFALLVAAGSGLLGDDWRHVGRGNQFAPGLSFVPVLSTVEFVVLLLLMWELRRVSIRGAALLVDDAERRTLFHVQVGALAALFALAWFTAPLYFHALGAPTMVLVAAVSRAGCDARNRVATSRAQLAAVLTVLAGLALYAWNLEAAPAVPPR